MRLPREDFDLRRLFAVRPPRTARFRDFAAVDLRAGLFFAALLRGRFFAGRDLARLTTLATLFLTAGTIGRPLAAAFPARAPTNPPTTAPTGPAILPIAAPATAPAVCFGIGGIWMSSDDCGLSFFCASGSSGINRGAPSVLFGCNQNVIRMTSLLQPFVHSFRENKKKRPPRRALFARFVWLSGRVFARHPGVRRRSLLHRHNHRDHHRRRRRPVGEAHAAALHSRLKTGLPRFCR